MPNSAPLPTQYIQMNVFYGKHGCPKCPSLAPIHWPRNMFTCGLDAAQLHKVAAKPICGQSSLDAQAAQHIMRNVRVVTVCNICAVAQFQLYDACLSQNMKHSHVFKAGWHCVIHMTNVIVYGALGRLQPGHPTTSALARPSSSPKNNY